MFPRCSAEDSMLGWNQHIYEEAKMNKMVAQFFRFHQLEQWNWP